MIFKYFAYDKLLKDWFDTKFYCSICVPGQLPKAKELSHLFYNKLLKNKMISMAPEYFSLQDQSSFSFNGVRTYNVTHLTASKRTSVGKLTQLPDRNNATSNSKIKDSWTVSPFKAVLPTAPVRMDFIIGRADDASRLGGWDAPRAARTTRINNPRINTLFGDIAVAPAPIPVPIPVPVPEVVPIALEAVVPERLVYVHNEEFEPLWDERNDDLFFDDI